MPAPRPEPPLTAEETGRLLDVSRETIERLAVYLELLARWQVTVNLVGGSTLADPWRRHVLDSGQLWRFWPRGARRLVDLGSGAGLPGLVLAILGAPEAHLIESDRRKAAFLREAARATGTGVTVHACRIEAAPPLEAEVVTARALAPLSALIGLAQRFIGPAGQCLFLKGRAVADELVEARRYWRMTIETHPSLTDPESSILLLREIARG